MNASGQGDEVGDVSKDDENEISSTTQEDKASELEASKVASIYSDAALIYKEASKSVKHDIESNEPVIDNFKPEKSPGEEIEKGPKYDTDDNNEEIAKEHIQLQDRVCSYEDEGPKASSSNAPDQNDSSSEEFELKWDEDDNNDDGCLPKTDDVLKLLDRELGIMNDFSKPGTDDLIKPIDNDKKEIEVLETSGNDSIENLKIIDQIDDLIGDDDNDKSKLDEPVILKQKEKDNGREILENNNGENQIYDNNAVEESQKSSETFDGEIINKDIEKAIDVTPKHIVNKEMSKNIEIEKSQKVDSTIIKNLDSNTLIGDLNKAQIANEEVSNDITEDKMLDTTPENQENMTEIEDSNAEQEETVDEISNDAVGIGTFGDDIIKQCHKSTELKAVDQISSYIKKQGEESSTITEKNIEITLESTPKPTVEEMDVDVFQDDTQISLPNVKEKIKTDETENKTEITTQKQEVFSPDMFSEDIDKKSPTKNDIAVADKITKTDNIKDAEKKTKDGADSGIKADDQCNTSKSSTGDSRMDITKAPIDNISKLIEAEKNNHKQDNLMDVELNESSKDTTQKDNENQLKVLTIESENDVIMIENHKVLEASTENIDKESKVLQRESDIVDVTESIPTCDDLSEVQKDEDNDAVNDDELLDTTINPNIHHRINKPNVMLDIPTQELSDIEAELDDDSYSELLDEIINTDSGKKDGGIVDGEKNNDSNLELSTDKEKDSKLEDNYVKVDKIIKSEIEKWETVIEKTQETEITMETSPIKMDVPTPSLGLRMVPISQLMKSQSKVIIDDASSKSKDILKEDRETSVQNVDEVSKSYDLTTADKNDETNSLESKEANTPQDDLDKSTSKVNEQNDAKPAILKTNEQDGVGTSISKTNEPTEATLKKDDAQPSTSKLTDDAVASTSKSTDDAVASTSKSTDDAVASTSKSTDDAVASTSKLTDDAVASTSKLTDDAVASTSKLTVDAVPSTSKDIVIEKLTSDTADEIQEVTDSLGLLAETSRVVDDDEDGDDDEPEDPEADDNDDDDFDPYDDSNSQTAVEHDDSTTPPPEMHHTDKPALEFKPGDSDEGTLDIADEIECVENDLPEIDLPGDDTLESPSVDDKILKDEPEIIDADEHKDGDTDKSCPPEKIINILEKVLGQQSTDAQVMKLKASGLTTVKVMNYVDVEGSSSEDDVLEVSKSNVTSVNIPKGVEVMSTSTSGPHSTSEIVSKEGDIIISGVPKPPPLKVSKLNTSEVSISVKSTPAQTDVQESHEEKSEIFNLDSDEEDSGKVLSMDEAKERAAEELPASDRKCINPQCTGNTSVYHRADRATAAFYSLSRRRAAVCEQCSMRVSERTQALLTGIKDLCPLMELDMACPSQQLVEISDSESDEDGPDDGDLIGVKGAEIRASSDDDTVGANGAKFLEDHLADMINETWIKYKLESRLKDTEMYLMDELDKMEAGAKEIDSLLNECQKKTDSMRTKFYKQFEPRRRNLGPIIIYDTPLSSYSHTENDVEVATESRYPKRRTTAATADPPAKRPAIPLGYAPLEPDNTETQDSSVEQSKVEDDKDISVVKLSAESAPADLPPCGEISRPPLKPGMVVYAMRNAFGTWLRGKVLEVQAKTAGIPYTHCRIKFEHKVKNPCKVLAARCLAYTEPSTVRMTIGTRIIALFKDPQNTARRDSFYSGVVAEIPNPVNSYRYLVFFDDGYAQYVSHQDTRVVCESSSLVWEEVHPFIRDFICNYLLSYPERPMVRLHAGEQLKTEWNGKWWDSKVLQVDASIALIYFEEDKRTEWIYRGSTRLAPLFLELQAAEKAGERHRSRLPRSKAQMRSNMPCVEYTRSDEPTAAKPTEVQVQAQHQEELRRQKAVAKKSTASQPQTQGTPLDGVISRVVYYTPKNAVKPYKMSPHNCTAKCKRTDVLSLKELRTYNPLAKPLLSGWERQTVRYKGQREVMYRAPCGRRLRNMAELHKYLRILNSDLSVDLFDFTPGTHCLAEFVLNTCIVGKKDLSHGKENVPVPCVNYFDDSLPEFCSYNTERTPTAGVPLNLDPEFLCGCDCTDDCVDKTKCACWKLTLEGARTIGLDSPNVGYEYRRLPEPLPSGIYECNSRCKCKNTCLNRVAQHPLNMKLQVFKTSNRGWGIRALNDVPKGSFLCVYAGNLLTDATANLDGLNEGDEYLAELDYIEVVEGMKEGYEEDIPKADKKLDKKAQSGKSESDESESSSESEEEKEPNEKDADFQPGYIPHPNMLFKKSLRKREKAKKKEQEKQSEEAKKRDDCITISDDEEVREPSRFTAQAGMADKAFSSKHRSVRSLYGEDEACYIMDAKVQGNIGRYLNHSCHPNVFVQNVFVDTHDPRFPWVAFFALSNVRAGTELTWNYNYDVGSVPGKVLYCYCGAPNCRGRLL